MSEVLFRGLLGCFEVRATVKRVQVATMTDARWSFAAGTVGESPAYFAGDARHQSWSCQLFVRVVVCWHVPSCLLLHVGGQVGRWCPCVYGLDVSVLGRFSVN